MRLSSSRGAVAARPFLTGSALTLSLADGARVDLGSRAFDILMPLIEAQDELVYKTALMRRVWGNIIVDESTLQRPRLAPHILRLRNQIQATHPTPALDAHMHPSPVHCRFRQRGRKR